MQTTEFDIRKGGSVFAGYEEENNARKIIFRGMKKQMQDSKIQIAIDDIGIFDLVDNGLIITSEHTAESGIYNACLVERLANDSYIQKSNTFTFVIGNSMAIGEPVQRGD